MKIVKNDCYGGFGLSVKAKQRLAELLGKKLYFFKLSFTGGYESIKMEEAEKGFFSYEFTVPNPQDYRMDERDEDGLYKGANERSKQISLPDYGEDSLRADPLLVQVIEELGKEANGQCADLVIVEVPDDIEWEVDEYDGWETIREKHQSW